MKRYFACVLLLIFHFIFGNAIAFGQQKDVSEAVQTQEPDSRPSKVSHDLDKNLESFDRVCEEIEKSHWDQSRLGESWERAKRNSRLAIEKSPSRTIFRSATGKLLETLGQSHFAIIPQDAFETIGKNEKVQPGHAGFDVRYIEESLVATRIGKNSPAETAGIKPGWQVKLIGPLTNAEILERAKKSAAHSPMRLDTAVATACDSFLSGKIKEKLPVAFIDNNNAVKLVTLELEARPGEPAKLGKYLPDFYTEFEERLLPNDVGYIRFNFFFGGPKTIRKYNDALKRFRMKKGVVIDIRGNRGGAGMMVVGMCNWFAKEQVSLGTQLFAGGQHMNLVLNPRLPRYDKPVALLIDECSGSAAELMASGIKDHKFGRLFGKTTAGMALPSVSTRLPNGDGFLHAIAGYRSVSGIEIEGKGVEPHDLSNLKRSDFKQSADPVLDRASQWILTQPSDHDE